jgi:thymidylate synthase
MGYIFVRRDTLPEAWEEAVLRCWKEGRRIRTEYDRAGDPESRDCTAFIVVDRPFQEPRLHRAFPGGLEELEIYRQEVVAGVHDDWVDPASGKWSYTYHQRLCAYEVRDEEGRVQRVDQVAAAIDKLASVPHTRRAQAITWRVDVDPHVDDPACLQRMWFRIFDDELQLNCHMRSNDAFKAAFMNMWAFTALQGHVAQELTRRMGREIRPGSYAHIADSFHIYGSYFNQFGGFLESLEKRSFQERVWDSRDALVQSAFASAREQLRREKESR